MKSINQSIHKNAANTILDKLYDIERVVKTSPGEGKRVILNKLFISFRFENELNRHLKQNIYEATKIWERER